MPAPVVWSAVWTVTKGRGAQSSAAPLLLEPRPAMSGGLRPMMSVVTHAEPAAGAVGGGVPQSVETSAGTRGRGPLS
jgi:hypothetical protein